MSVWFLHPLIQLAGEGIPNPVQVDLQVETKFLSAVRLVVLVVALGMAGMSGMVMMVLHVAKRKGKTQFMIRNPNSNAPLS